ncbi:hypothetical protein FDECE_16079 [Fusarium decemcellulare]|nr:hypothetical protein FDECE_16079 [Fusarium decemcellulare]
MSCQHHIPNQSQGQGPQLNRSETERRKVDSLLADMRKRLGTLGQIQFDTLRTIPEWFNKTPKELAEYIIDREIINWDIKRPFNLTTGQCVRVTMVHGLIIKSIETCLGSFDSQTQSDGPPNGVSAASSSDNQPELSDINVQWYLDSDLFNELFGDSALTSASASTGP